MCSRLRERTSDGTTGSQWRLLLASACLCLTTDYVDWRLFRTSTFYASARVSVRERRVCAPMARACACGSAGRMSLTAAMWWYVAQALRLTRRTMVDRRGEGRSKIARLQSVVLSITSEAIVFAAFAARADSASGRARRSACTHRARSCWVAAQARACSDCVMCMCMYRAEDRGEWRAVLKRHQLLLLRSEHKQ